MAEKGRNVLEIDYCYSSLDQEGIHPPPTISCVKNRDQIKELEGREDCFILEFDPYVDEIVSVSKGFDDDVDLCVVSEKGQVACRDYPHSRQTCAKYPFETTPHDSHCELCYCYICDSPAPCKKWAGSSSSGHCHAFDTEYWDEKREERKLEVARGGRPHFRHNCSNYPFEKTPHGTYCELCCCCVCDSPAPCRKWLGSSGHCHASSAAGSRDGERGACRLRVSLRDRPHFRFDCAKYPFDKTPHDSHCRMCYCYVCDTAAPCRKWLRFPGHCDALDSESWRKEKASEKLFLRRKKARREW